MATFRIAAQMIAYQTVEAIEILAHVRRAGCNIYPRRRSKPEHRLRPVQYGQQALQRFRIESPTHFDPAPAPQLNNQNTFAPSAAVGIPRRGRNHFNGKQRSGSRLRPALHASAIFIQRPYSQAPLLAKRRPQQSARFKLRNQRIDPSPAPPSPHHSRFTHNSSAPLNAAQEQGALLRRLLLNERRRRAVKLREAGLSVRETARQCELSMHTVVTAHKAYRRGGWAQVKICRSGRPPGSGRQLSADQEQKIQCLIADRMPGQLKLAYALWTRQAVSELIEAIYGVRLTVRNTGKYLKRWGFTPQRPLKKAYEQSPAAKAKTEGAEIQWGDETGLRSDDVRGRGYAPKGQTPVVLANANREKLSVISTVTNKGQMRWKVFSGALNAKVLTGFLERLARQQEKKIFLILDNLRVHHSKPVKKWLAEHAEKIEVFYLPSYSPELNPDELLNANLKQRVTKTVPAKNKIALTRTAIGALRSIQKQPQRVESYFQQKNVCYAAA
jgi:transposase